MKTVNYRKLKKCHSDYSTYILDTGTGIYHLIGPGIATYIKYSFDNLKKVVFKHAFRTEINLKIRMQLLI